jgi:hypothetical protein
MHAATDLRARFESRLPEIRRVAERHFHFLNAEALEQAVQNVTVLAWQYLLNAERAGKGGREDVFHNIVKWACRHTRQGRQAGGCGTKAGCVLDHARRGSHNVVVDRSVDLNHFVGRSASVPDAVAFRLDVPAFLATLPDRDRQIALSLARGQGTGEVARAFGVTPGAISQFRSRFKRRYDEYHAAV